MPANVPEEIQPLRQRMRKFIDEEVIPAEADLEHEGRRGDTLERLKRSAKAQRPQALVLGGLLQASERVAAATLVLELVLGGDDLFIDELPHPLAQRLDLFGDVGGHGGSWAHRRVATLTAGVVSCQASVVFGLSRSS